VATPESSDELEHVKDLLEDLASTLTKLYEAGVPVELKFGSVFSDYGYCLQNEDGSWRAAVKIGGPPKWWSKHDRKNPDDC
jgi:hypothetical protein